MVLTLRYNKVDLNKSSDIFREKLINYTIKELNNTEEFLMLVHELKGLNPFFDYKNKPKDLNVWEARS